MTNALKTQQIAAGQGFIAALDQSGGSTPKALLQYGVAESDYTNDAEMFDQIHAMRARIVKSPAFTGEKVVGAILFEMTMDRDIDGTPTADYLWNECNVVPFLKVDKGLAEIENGAQCLKPMPELDTLLTRAVEKNVYGTKMRSVILEANQTGIEAVVRQQFEIGVQILGHGLMPIIEPEITITMENKAKAEQMLCDSILAELDKLAADQQVMLKLTLPEVANQYKVLADHPKVLKVVALSGGYSRAVANEMLSKNSNMIASFSRALTEGLSAQQTDTEFNAVLAQTIDSIYQASISG